MSENINVLLKESEEVFYTDAGYRELYKPPVYLAFYNKRFQMVEELTNRGVTSSTEAEYLALIMTLKFIGANCMSNRVLLVNDNEVMIRHLDGTYRVGSHNLVPLYEQAITLLDSLAASGLDIRISYLPREENKADALIRKYKRKKK
jgi:ribonuclease HI